MTIAIPLFEQKSPGLIALLMSDFPTSILTIEDAAAWPGNFGEESGGFRLLQEQNPLRGGAGGYGWGQWTGPRRVAFENYCARNHLDPSSNKANYGWFWNEIQGPFAHVLILVRLAKTLEDKVKVVMLYYEMPLASAEHLADRVAYAKRAIAAYNAAPKPVPPLMGAVDAPVGRETSPAQPKLTPATKPSPSSNAGDIAHVAGSAASGIAVVAAGASVGFPWWVLVIAAIVGAIAGAFAIEHFRSPPAPAKPTIVPPLSVVQKQQQAGGTAPPPPPKVPPPTQGKSP